jgi:hypothetical protein
LGMGTTAIHVLRVVAVAKAPCTCRIRVEWAVVA